MKALIPSAREKKRYLKIQGGNLKKNVPKSIYQYIGELGMSQASLMWIKVNSNSSIVSINRSSLEKIRAAFCLSKDKIEVIKVSGTLAALNK